MTVQPTRGFWPSPWHSGLEVCRCLDNCLADSRVWAAARCCYVLLLLLLYTNTLLKLKMDIIPNLHTRTQVHDKVRTCDERLYWFEVCNANEYFHQEGAFVYVETQIGVYVY